jgi:hypothetical protein
VCEDRVIRRLALAGLTQAENLVAVVHGTEIELTANLFLQLFQVGTEELDDGIAVQADQMVVVLVASHGLVVRVLIPKAAFPHQPTLHQQIQRPVDRGTADGLAFLLQSHMQLVSVEMMGLAEDFLDQFEALTGQFQLAGPKKGLESLLFLGPFHLGFAHSTLGGQSTRIVSKPAFYKREFMS